MADDDRWAPIPGEGGWFRRTWVSAETTADGGPVGTAIVAVFTPERCSAMHRLGADEVWHFYGGDPFELLLLDPDGRAETRRLGPGGEVQLVVPAGVWMGGSVVAGGEYSLTGATMAPGFRPEEFEMADRAALTAAYPTHAARIAELTRG